MNDLTQKPLMNIYKAISAFQQECPVIHKGTTGHNYTYADLPAILEIIYPLLKKHKLGFIQPLEGDTLKTIVFHIETGEQIESSVNIPQITLRGMNEYQSLGSGISYFRRYALTSFFGLVSDKDTDAAGEKVTAVFIKKHKSVLDLTLAIDMCESISELTKLYNLNKDLLNEGIKVLFTSKKEKL